jgi:hypothetical protein
VERTIKKFIPASWFHPVGVFKVLARIWDRLPDVSGKLFLAKAWTLKHRRNKIKTTQSRKNKAIQSLAEPEPPRS